MANLDLVFSFQITDADGDVKPCELYATVTDSTTLAGIQTWASGTQTVLDALCDGKVTDNSITIKLALAGTIKANPIAGSDVQEGGLLTGALSGSARVHSTYIPAIKQTTLDGNTVDITDTDVTDFWNRINTVTSGIRCTNPFGFVLTTLLKGKKTFRK